MCYNDDKLKLCLTIDEKTIYDFDEVINENSIIKTAKEIENLLIQHQAKPSKIQNVYETLIEIMQNILNYSYGNIELPDNKREANGSITLSYNSEDDVYILQTCNLIEASQEQIIKDKLFNLQGLDDKELRRLARKKMRNREDNHEKGAGLGFITIARKCSAPIEVDFSDISQLIKEAKFKLII
jgi:hypothetical protein